MAQNLMAQNLWFDVEDLFEYAASNPRPSGIQRLAFEIYCAVQRHPAEAGRIHFVRHDQVRQSFRTVPWAAVLHLFDQLTNAPEIGRSPGISGGIAPESRRRWLARRLVHRLPPGFRLRLLGAARLQIQAMRALAELLRFCLSRAAARLRRRQARPDGAALGADQDGGFAALAQPGDFLVVLGAPWSHPDYGGLIRDTKARFGVRFAVLVFDIIPIRRPEWCDRGLVRAFRAWFTALLPQADVVLAISRATAGDVERFAAESGIALPAPVQVIPIGTGFGGPGLGGPGLGAPDIAATPGPDPAAPGRLPPAGSYVLFVSTIEARKNHLLLFRVWRRMLEEMPRDRVPTLVFAGRVGWMVADLMQQLVNTDYLDRRICLLADVSDAELARLYHGCLFTVFPSLYEGWGLPVTESLAFGKPCLAARGSSLPEAGGSLARYFDPDSVGDAYAAIRAVIEDPQGLREWQAEVARGFTPVSWTTTGNAILRCLGAAHPAGGEGVPCRT